MCFQRKCIPWRLNNDLAPYLLVKSFIGGLIESTLAEQFPISELLDRDIEFDREPWLERANINLEDKLEKANKALELKGRWPNTMPSETKLLGQSSRRHYLKIKH